MKVRGIEITQAQIDACLARMKLEPFFRSYQIETAAERAGVGETMRMVDRLIQRERKAGRIALANRSGLWKYVGSGDNGSENPRG